MTRLHLRKRGLETASRLVEEGWGAKILAEFVAVFALVFIGAGSIITNQLAGGGVGLLGVAFAHGLVLAVFVTATMSISGGHINPAVTLAMVSTGRMEKLLGALYVVTQLLGATLAAFALTLVFPEDATTAASLGATIVASGVTTLQAILLEAILTFFLVFTVFATGVDTKGPRVGGFAIGLVLVFDILVGGPLTGASMNPARSFGPALVANIWDNHVVYWIGPILGAVLAGLLYEHVYLRKV